MMNREIEYRSLQLSDFDLPLLKTFKRDQVTHRVWYVESGRCQLKDDHFVDRWDDEKKEQVMRTLAQCLRSGGVVFGAFVDHDLVGFASVESERFGVAQDYLELSYLHVSHDYRNCGIGKRLFEQCCAGGKRMGAKKLYIAAHPAEETQHFYRSVGCTLAVELNRSIYEKEKLDLQLEVLL
ncbi:GNAT family N-acetyltransferase [Tumebacillus lipolyticus]|uniref:GNAT family N-acetyltransferase n=1 Tax=Tumebacillus lipolyticus TaxID=1280370 RepID=A0ABW4ZXV9_9BACL